MTLDKLLINQTHGRFRVPRVVEQDCFLQKWRTKLKSRDAPLIVAEETYYRSGIGRKLDASEHMVKKLAHYGLLRPRDTKKFVHKGPYVKEPVSTLSLAQTISWVFLAPIEKVLLSEKYLSSEEFCREPHATRINVLFDAYAGCRWFDSFCMRIRRIAQHVPVPKIRQWQTVKRHDLCDMFITASDMIHRLIRKGFVIPANGVFVPKSLNNDVSKKGLVVLVARLFGSSVEEVWKHEENSYIPELAAAFVEKKVLPYLDAQGIAPNSYYRFAEAARFTRMRVHKFYAAYYEGTIPARRIHGCLRIRGIDLALYLLKHADKYVFTDQDIADLFGVEKVKCSHLGMKQSERGTYSRNHYVFPTYDLVAKAAKQLLEERKFRIKQQF